MHRIIKCIYCACNRTSDLSTKATTENINFKTKIYELAEKSIVFKESGGFSQTNASICRQGWTEWINKDRTRHRLDHHRETPHARIKYQWIEREKNETDIDLQIAITE